MGDNEWLATFIEESLKTIKKLEKCIHANDKEIGILKVQVKILYGILISLLIYTAKRYFDAG